jgi:hypothetical protein
MFTALASSPRVRLSSTTNTQGLPSYRLTYIAFAELQHACPVPSRYQVGRRINNEIPGRFVRLANQDDADACNTLCLQVHGFDRAGEVSGAIANGTALVVEGDQGISGYTTGVGFAGHGVGASNVDLKALIASVDEFSGPGVIIPTTNGELFKWCLENGMRATQQLTLMDSKPSGPTNGYYWPGILC